MPEKVFINGMGTVGSRIARMLMSLDISVAGAKVTAREDDIKTQELLSLYNDYKDLEIYVVDGLDYKKREKSFEDFGFNVKGPLSKIDYDEIGYIIDASPKYTEDKNYSNIYKKVYEDKKINFMIQGGGNEKIVHSHYLSAPNCKGALEFDDLSGKNVKQVSCNTTGIATNLGIVLDVEDEKNIDIIVVYPIRRQKDTGTKPNEPMKKGLETKINSHHGADVRKVLEQLGEKIKPTTALKGPWEHFHELIINTDFKKSYDYDAIKEKFEEYPRAVMLENDFDMDHIIERTEDLVPDADCLFPLYHLRQINGKKLEGLGIVPQRSIVCPSTVDMVVKKLIKPDAPWEEVFDYVNKNATWHGKSFKVLKDKLKYKTRPES